MIQANDPIRFKKVQEYIFVQELGQGACGKTVLLRDEFLDTNFVAKKYNPYSDDHREELFEKFIREIKLLHRLNHRNIVRIFDHYIYPEILTGFIIMEYINGEQIDRYVQAYPDRINDLFRQAIEGFHHLETKRILHRDIRQQNLMVTDDGLLKIIDLGFGKQIQLEGDYGISVSLNQWCEPPSEHSHKVYSFQTEIYYVGHLFRVLIENNEINDFKYQEILRQMCESSSEDRFTNFLDILTPIRSGRFDEPEFSPREQMYYRSFADAIHGHITKIETETKYILEADQVEQALTALCRSVALEECVPDARTVCECILKGGYYCKTIGLRVSVVKDFLELIRYSGQARKDMILENLHRRMDTIPRYSEADDDDIPF